MTQKFMDRQPALRSLIQSAHLTPDIVSAWHQAVFATYEDLSRTLPDGNLWKGIALESALRSQRLFAQIAPDLGCDEIETYFFGLLVFTQSLGRLIESYRTFTGQPKAAWHHGVDTVSELRRLLSPGVLKMPIWEVSLVAIRHRPDPLTPKFDAIGNEAEATSALIGLLRDCVKREAYAQERLLPKLNDPGAKAQLRLENWSTEAREAHPQLGTEQGKIAPASQLERFVNHLPLQRKEYETYETLMLEILAYLFDVASPEFAELIVNEGGPGNIFAYLEQQLRPTSNDQLIDITQALARWNQNCARVICGF